ncbi:MAG: hypothetical protein PHS34_09055 [Candidatus Omnitrophica bacterium]|nr:hypothetical protein [Candidatus Omnitrophota bacterium]
MKCPICKKNRAELRISCNHCDLLYDAPDLESQLQLIEKMKKRTFYNLVEWWLQRSDRSLDYLTTSLYTVLESYLKEQEK